MTDSSYIVKSTPLTAFIGSFQHFAKMLQTHWRCTCGSLMLKKYLLTKWQGFELSRFPTMFVLWLIVYTCTLWNQLLLELLLDLFNTLQKCYRDIEDVDVEVWCGKKYFLTNWQGFELKCFYEDCIQWIMIGNDSAYFVKSTFYWIFSTLYSMLQAYWRCAWRSLMLKKIFLTKWHAFELNVFTKTASNE